MTEQPPGSGPGPPFGADPGPSAIERPGPAGERQESGAARVLALLTAGLGLAVYQLGFVGDVSVTGTFSGPMLVAGGLLAGSAVLPQVGRVLGPAAVLVVTGTLLLLQLVIGLGWPRVLIVALVLAVLQTAAVLGALLLDSGVLAGRPDRRTSGPPNPGSYPGYPAGGAAGVGRGQLGSPGYARPTDPTAHGGVAPAAIGPGPPGNRSWSETADEAAPGAGSPADHWGAESDRGTPGGQARLRGGGGVDHGRPAHGGAGTGGGSPGAAPHGDRAARASGPGRPAAHRWDDPYRPGAEAGADAGSLFVPPPASDSAWSGRRGGPPPDQHQSEPAEDDARRPRDAGSDQP